MIVRIVPFRLGCSSTMSSLNRICAAAAIIALLATNAVAGPKRVLLLNSFGPQFGPWNFYTERFREELVKQSPNEIDLYEVSLLGARFVETEDQGPIIEYLRSLFAVRKLDLIVSFGAPAARFAQRFRPQFFPSTPLVIGAAEQRLVDEAGLTANDTYVPSKLNLKAWIENILRVLPDTKHIAWAIGASPLERYWSEYIRGASEAFSNRVTFELFDTLTFDQMLKRVAELPPHSAIFYIDLRVDAAGLSLDSLRAFERLYQAARAPMFSYVDGYFGHGIVGGPLRSSRETGRTIAAVAVRILGGETPGNIKVEPLTEGTPIYDWRELQRWGIDEHSLPSGSAIVYRTPTIWQQYRWPITGAGAALLFQAALIAWLIYEHRRRQRAEVQSRNSMAELTNLNRAASVGLLSASLAHEVNQPLTGIVLQANAALRWLAAKPANLGRAQTALTQIVDAGHRASEIVTNVKAMFRKDDRKVNQPVDINELIRSVLGLIHMDLRKQSVETQMSLADHLPAVSGNAVQLQQVILNLVMNAIEAMSSTEPRVLSIKSELDKDNCVRASIRDTGTGIDPANAARIFKPLFTTKARGMGMGLSICHSIIEAHAGKIRVSPGPERGTIFEGVLPPIDAEPLSVARSDPTCGVHRSLFTPTSPS